MKGIMVQGTSSDAGKSLLCIALCRWLRHQGVRVAPFKSQNMSNYLVRVGSHQVISAAQAMQAEAARILPTVEMNPLLLVPEGEMQARLYCRGEEVGVVSGQSYRLDWYERGCEVIRQAMASLAEQVDYLVLEGAGSPVELNLKDRELVNMKVAELADVPVLLIADIERGGVFASIVGTIELLEKEERKRVQGIIINKFRGDLQLFQDGIKLIEARIGIPVLGVIPYVKGLEIPAEDSLATNGRKIEESSRESREAAYEAWTTHVCQHLDMGRIWQILQSWQGAK